MRRRLVFWLLLAGGLGAARAAVVLQPMKPEATGDAALESVATLINGGENEAALRQLAAAAEKGSAGALFGLGWMHEQGRGVAASAVVAQTFYLKAAERGNVPAMFNLAALLERSGQPGGRTWLEKAAQAGSGRAALALGRVLAAEKAPEAAATWLRKAVLATETGGEAAVDLAELLDPKLTGQGEAGKEALQLLQTASDQGTAAASLALTSAWARSADTLPRAIALLEKTASTGSAEAEFRLGILASEGRLPKATQQDAAAHFRTAAERGHAVAANELASRYQAGNGVAKDAAKAFEWFRKAAELGLPIAQLNTGICLEEGLGTTADATAACQWYAQSAAAGCVPAQNRLALRYLDGRGVPKDAVAARSWLGLAAGGGFEPAALNFAGMLARGEGGPRDAAMARRILEDVAKRSRPEGQFALATQLELGLGGPPEPARALALHRLAAPKHAAAKERAELLSRSLPPDAVKEAERLQADPAQLFTTPPAAKKAP